MGTRTASGGSKVVGMIAIGALIAVLSIMVGMGIGAKMEKAPVAPVVVAPTNQPPTLESLAGKVVDLDGKVELLGQIVVKQKAELDSLRKWTSDNFARYHNELALVSRTLSDDYGKSKWQRMVEKSMRVMTDEANKEMAKAEKAKTAGK